MNEPIIPVNDEDRQQVRVFDYMFHYFYLALIAKARHSYVSNLKHNGEEGMKWAHDKSIGDGNQIIRHLIDAFDAVRRGDKKEASYHFTCVAWRGDELLERWERKMAPFDKL